MTEPLPPISDVETIRERLQRIFPPGTPNRGYVVREMAARTVFVMLYVGALRSNARFVRPDQIVRMNEEQATRTTQAQRHAWYEASLTSRSRNTEAGWYAANTRESIRDETLRVGLRLHGATFERSDVPTTSSKPKHTLEDDFAALFDTSLTGTDLDERIADWRENHLTAAARARIQLLEESAESSVEGVLVRLPNGEVRRMAEGPSSEISRAVIEEFANRFLKNAAVVFLSESRAKVVAKFDTLAKSIGIDISQESLLPDIILADIGRERTTLVFVEVVASEGPISADRKEQLAELAKAGGHAESDLVFVTAYLDRGHAAFRRTVERLAWGTYVWFMAEPGELVVLWEQGLEERSRLH